MKSEPGPGRLAAALIAGRSVGFACRFLTAVLLARYLAQTEFGLYKQAFLVQGTFLLLIGFGLPASLYYFLQFPAAQRRVFMATTLGALGLGGLVGGVALAATAPWWGAVFHDGLVGSLAPALGLLAGTALVGSLLEPVLIAQRRTVHAAVTYCGTDIVQAVLVLGVVALGHGVVGILLVVAAVNVVRILVLLGDVHRSGLLAIEPGAWPLVREQWRYAFPLWCAGILEIVAASAPFYYVSALHTAGVYALFSVGCLSVPFVETIYSSVSDVVLVQITRLQRSGQARAVPATVAGGVRRVALVCFPLFVLLEVFAADVIQVLYTERFAAAVPVFRVYLLLLVLTAVHIDYVPRAYGDMRFLFLVSGGRAAACLALVPVLTAALGLPGAILAFILALAATHLVVFARASTLMGVPARSVLPWSTLGLTGVACFIAAVPAGAVARAVVLPSWATVALAGAVFVAGYLTVVWRFGLLSAGEQKAIGAVARHILAGSARVSAEVAKP